MVLRASKDIALLCANKNNRKIWRIKDMRIKLLITLILILSAAPLIAAEQGTVRVDDVVVTATRYGEKLVSIPANVTVISEGDIEDSTAQNIPDLLRTEAGLHVNDIAGNRRNITVDIRGFGETSALNTLVLVDGRRVNQADLSGTDWTQIPVDRVKRIEIIRGGRGAVLYGDNAAGGVINIITKEGEQFKAGTEAVAGSFSTYKGSAYVSGSRDTLSYSLTGSYLSSEGHRTNSDTEATDIGVNLGYYPKEFILLNFSSGYHKDNTGLPGALKESELDAGYSREDSVNPDDFAEIEDYYFKAAPEVYFGEDSLVKLDLSFRRRDFQTFATFAGGEFASDTEIETLSLSPQLVLKNETESITNSLTVGMDYQDVQERIMNDSLFFGSRTIGEFELKKKTYGYYIHDEIGVTEGLLVSGGYRYDRADFNFHPGTPDSRRIDEELFTAGVNYNFYKESHLYLSYSKSFRYPVFDEMFSFFTNTVDTGLIPQRSDDYEIGLRHYFTDSLNAQVNFFRIDTDNEIFFNPETFKNENLDGKSRRDGVEISFSAQPMERLTLSGSYTYMEATIEGGRFEGNGIPNVPDHRATLGAVLDLGAGLSVALNAVYTGERPFVSDFEGDFSDQDDFLVINGKLKYKRKMLTAFLDINNMTNRGYSEYGVLGGFPLEKAFYPSPERNFLFGVSVDF
jgi:iron complex outermembrane receptor protein